MNDDTRPVHHPAVETAVLGPEAVLYDERSGAVHHLNESACAIWILLDGRPVRDVVATLSRASGLPPAMIREDVVRTIGGLQAAGLIAGSTEGPAGG